MIIVQNLAYSHTNKDLLFEHINLSLNKHNKIALIGNNGAGKSTLLKIIAGALASTEGSVHTGSKPYYLPQLYGQFNHYTIAQALGIEARINALHEILDGKVTEENLTLLDEDWTIEERCADALAYWQLNGLEMGQEMGSLSGGQRTKVFLAGITIHQPEIILLDEPSNHLDTQSRQLLYDFIEHSTATMIVVSHDRTLLNLLQSVYELSKWGISIYGGNYDFYAGQKMIEEGSLNQNVKNQEKALRKAKEIERETMERQQKLDARGRKKQEKSGLPTISMNTLRNNAEKSTARTKEIHTGKIEIITQELNNLRKELPDADKMKFDFDPADLHKGKVLLTATGINYAYQDQWIWTQAMNLLLVSGMRMAVKGPNGSGKTTLIKLILGLIQPGTGIIHRALSNAVYIDQDYSLIGNSKTVYDQAQSFNTTALREHEIKIRLSRFLFTKDYWDKPCDSLSGGEKMRLMLCCLTIGNKAPDMIILDEPTNNLDLQNIGILTAAINDYQGTLLVVSHDDYFLNQINIQQVIQL